MLHDPEGHNTLVRRLAEHGNPAFPGFPRFSESPDQDRMKSDVE